MKLKFLFFVLTLLTTSISTVSSSTSFANECSPSNPCGTWAVVDNHGTVTNIIVCQASVCGGGEFAGQKVVLQVAPDLNTGESQGGYFGGINKENGVVTYEETNNIFTVSDVEGSERMKFAGPELEVDGSYTSTSANFCSDGSIENSECVEVKSTNQSVNNTISESNIFKQRKNAQEVQDELAEKELNLLLSKINIILKLLSEWLID